MHFERLMMENVGPFEGVQRIDFGYSQEASAVVICGGNGSGKTSVFRAIEWALGRAGQSEGRFDSQQLIRNGTKSASVTLRFSLGGRNYEVTRRGFDADEKLRSEEVQLSVRTNREEKWGYVSNPDEHMESLLPKEVRAILLDCEGLELHLALRRASSSRLNIPKFKSWATARLESAGFAAAGGQGERTFTFLKHLFASRETHEAIGVIHFARMHTMMLFREWLLAADVLPSGWESLRGESLPWMLDSPFTPMDTDLRIEAAKLLSRSSSQIVLAVNPIELKPCVETVIEPRLGHLRLLRTGANDFGNSSVHAFGRTLDLSHGDDDHFSEILVGNGQDQQSHG